MRRGLITVRGDAASGLGRGLIAGTILALGTVGKRLGAGMKRGTLIAPQLTVSPDDLLLPTFAQAGRFRLPFLTLYFRQLAEWGFPVPRAVQSALLDRYNGDLAVGGQGEILVGMRA
jgi:formylmethanofuran dehydrogenase subunit C